MSIHSSVQGAAVCEALREAAQSPPRDPSFTPPGSWRPFAGK